jgi:nucleoid-associated protein EbfC
MNLARQLIALPSDQQPIKFQGATMIPKGGLGALMKQAQQMQENMKRAQEQLASIDVEGAAGGGMVKVTMSCKNDVKRVAIDASVMDDREMLEDLIAAAMNDAVRKAEAVSAEKMSGFTQGMGMPPGFKLPF